MILRLVGCRALGGKPGSLCIDVLSYEAGIMCPSHEVDVIDAFNAT